MDFIGTRALAKALICPRCQSRRVRWNDEADIPECAQCAWKATRFGEALDLLVTDGSRSNEPRSTNRKWSQISERISARLGFSPNMADELTTQLSYQIPSTGNPGLDAEEDIFVERFGILNEAIDIQFEVVFCPQSATPGQTFWVSARLKNRGPFPITSEGPNPVLLSYHWYDERGQVAVYDGRRTALPMTLAADSAITLPILVEGPTRLGRYCLRILPVKELVRWIDECHFDIRVEIGDSVRIVQTPVRSEEQLGPFSETADNELATQFIDQALRGEAGPIRACEIGGGIRPAFLEAYKAIDNLDFFLNADISLRLLQVGRLILRGKQMAADRSVYARADANKLPLQRGSIDVVVFSRALHHFVHPDRTLAEVARVLRPGGHLFLVCEPVASVYDEHTLDLMRRGVNEQVFPDGFYSAIAESAGLIPQTTTLDWGFSFKGSFRSVGRQQ